MPLYIYPQYYRKQLVVGVVLDGESYVPRKRNCISSGVSFSIEVLSLLMVPLIMFAFFSCNITIRDSTESSMHSRVMTHGRFCPIR